MPVKTKTRRPSTRRTSPKSRDWLRAFRSPPVEYRPAPLWSWNDELREADLVRQVRQMRQMGFGGFFMHPREGMITPYLSDAFMAAVKTSVNAAKREGVKAWIYDEDRWPSGMGGGIVGSESPDYRLHSLRMMPVESPTSDAAAIEPKRRNPKILRTFAIEASDGQIVRAEPWSPERPGNNGQQVFAFVAAEMPPEEWYHNQPTVDALNPATARAFIRSTHEVYRRHVGREFGKTIPGVFTDEVCCYHSLIWWPQTVTWNDAIPAAFRKRYGYDLLEHLSLLFLRGPGFERVRFHFWQLVSALIVENFTKPLAQWCGWHGLQLTGHFEDEEPFYGQVVRTGASMPHYPEMQIPGFDSLGRGVNISVVGGKQCTSAAHQFGRTRVICELHGAGGWDFDFAQQKREADRIFVYGANLLNPHFTAYTIRGIRKRDFPLFFSEQQPWWRKYKPLADYLTRVSYALSQGTFLADCAVIHPISTAWALTGASGADGLAPYESAVHALGDWLMARHVAFDFIDEGLLKRHGRAAGASLRVGKAAYPLVILPPLLVLRRSTLEMLKEFAESGGTVVALTPLPTLLDASEPLDLRRELPSMHVFDGHSPELDALLRGGAHLSVTDASGDEAADVLTHTRVVGDDRLVFVSNQSLTKRADVTIGLRGDVRASRLDALTGHSSRAASSLEGGRVVVKETLGPMGSALLHFEPGAASADAAASPTGHSVEDVTEIPGPWTVELTEPNVLLLDRCEYRFIGGATGTGEWSTPSWVFEAHQAAEARSVGVAPGSFEAELRFTFESQLTSHRGVELAIESPEQFRITVNGKGVPPGDVGFWRDRSIRRIPVGAALQSGTNEIVLRTPFVPPKRPGTLKYVPGGTELENVYLLGDFHVSLADASPTLRPAERGADVGDLSQSGYPFYSGAARYSATFTRSKGDANGVTLELPGFAGVIAEVDVNGKREGDVYLPAYRIPLHHARAGKNRIAITLYGSCRNSLGPHHSTTPGTFVWLRHFLKHPEWTDEYRVVPFGLLTAPRLIRHTVDPL